MPEDLLIKKLLLEVFGEQLAHMVSEWERLVSNKDDVHYWLTKTIEAFGDELEKIK